MMSLSMGSGWLPSHARQLLKFQWFTSLTINHENKNFIKISVSWDCSEDDTGCADVLSKMGGLHKYYGFTTTVVGSLPKYVQSKKFGVTAFVAPPGGLTVHDTASIENQVCTMENKKKKKKKKNPQETNPVPLLPTTYLAAHWDSTWAFLLLPPFSHLTSQALAGLCFRGALENARCMLFLTCKNAHTAYTESTAY